MELGMAGWKEQFQVNFLRLSGWVGQDAWGESAPWAGAEDAQPRVWGCHSPCLPSVGAPPFVQKTKRLLAWCTTLP